MAFALGSGSTAYSRASAPVGGGATISLAGRSAAPAVNPYFSGNLPNPPAVMPAPTPAPTPTPTAQQIMSSTKEAPPWEKLVNDPLMQQKAAYAIMKYGGTVPQIGAPIGSAYGGTPQQLMAKAYALDPNFQYIDPATMGGNVLYGPANLGLAQQAADYFQALGKTGLTDYTATVPMTQAEWSKWAPTVATPVGTPPISQAEFEAQKTNLMKRAGTNIWDPKYAAMRQSLGFYNYGPGANLGDWTYDRWSREIGARNQNPLTTSYQSYLQQVQNQATSAQQKYIADTLAAAQGLSPNWYYEMQRAAAAQAAAATGTAPAGYVAPPTGLNLPAGTSGSTVQYLQGTTPAAEASYQQAVLQAQQAAAIGAQQMNEAAAQQMQTPAQWQAREQQLQELMTGYGAEQRRQLEARQTQAIAAAKQNLLNRGLTSSTAYDTAMRAIERGGAADLAALEEQLRKERLGYQTNWSAETLGAQTSAIEAARQAQEAAFQMRQSPIDALQRLGEAQSQWRSLQYQGGQGMRETAANLALQYQQLAAQGRQAEAQRNLDYQQMLQSQYANYAQMLNQQVLQYMGSNSNIRPGQAITGTGVLKGGQGPTVARRAI